MSKDEANWPALDLLRGIAAVLMIANHAAVRWCRPVDVSWASSAAFWAGGLAPALFFFATGFGYGVQHSAGSGGKAHRYGFLRKVLVLCVADWFAPWAQRAGVLRIDFLGFIGASMLALEPLRRTRRGPALASALLVAVIAVRFGLSPVLTGLGIDPTEWASVTGRSAVAWNSYPPFPWLAFPLLGFVLGAAAERARARLRMDALAIACFLSATLAFAASAGLSSAGYPLHRYGTMSVAYLPLALGGIASVASVALAWQSWGAGSFARAIALRGLASLLVVPVHYWLLSALRPLVPPQSTVVFVVVLTVAVIAALALSRWATRWAMQPGPFAARWGVACLAFGTLAALLLNVAPIPAGAGRAALAFSGQIAVCLLFVLPLRSTGASRTEPRSLSGAQ